MIGAVGIGDRIKTALSELQTTDHNQLDLGLFLVGSSGGVDSLGGRATLNAGKTLVGFIEGSKNINTEHWQAVTGIKVSW